MAAPGRKFSFNRMVNNMFPPLLSGSVGASDIDVTPQNADILFIHQLTNPKPQYLSPEAFLHAGVVGNKTLSRSVWKQLVAAGIIGVDPQNEAAEDAGTDGAPMSPVEGERRGSFLGLSRRRSSVVAKTSEPVETRKIDRTFVSKVSNLSVFAQKKLVGMLFHWEEEVMRWRLLDEEEAEILKVLEGEADGHWGNVDLRVALESVDVRRKLRPSLRGGQEGGRGGSGVREELPGYA